MSFLPDALSRSADSGNSDEVTVDDTARRISDSDWNSFCSNQTSIFYGALVTRL